MIETLSRLDSELMMALNGHYSPLTDNFMWLYSGKLVWIGFYLCILYAIKLRYGWRRSLAILLLISLMILLCDQVCGNWVRHAIQRLRPGNPDNPLSQYIHVYNNHRGGPYGFPSCHAANSFGLAVFISLLFRYRKITLMMLGWALITIYSRIVLGMHYPGDLIVGAAVGSVIALGFYYMGHVIYYRIRETLAPWATRQHDCPRQESARWIAAGLLLTIAALLIAATAMTL